MLLKFSWFYLTMLNYFDRFRIPSFHSFPTRSRTWWPSNRGPQGRARYSIAVLNCGVQVYFLFLRGIHVTSFSSIPYWSNSEYWPLKLISEWEHPFHNIICLWWLAERSNFPSTSPKRIKFWEFTQFFYVCAQTNTWVLSRRERDSHMFKEGRYKTHRKKTHVNVHYWNR